MTFENDYIALLPQLKKLPSKIVIRPHLPVDVIAQEANDLHNWAALDKETLLANGLNWNLVESLPLRAGALRQAESNWQMELQRKALAGTLWKGQYILGLELRNHIKQNLRYALRKNKEALEHLRMLGNGLRYSGLILDLYTLAEFGNRYAKELKTKHFDFELLTQGQSMAVNLGKSLADYMYTNREKEVLDLRNRAYTYLHEAVKEINLCGRFCFNGNRVRLKGYGSRYKRMRRGRKTGRLLKMQ